MKALVLTAIAGVLIAATAAVSGDAHAADLAADFFQQQSMFGENIATTVFEEQSLFGEFVDTDPAFGLDGRGE